MNQDLLEQFDSVAQTINHILPNTVAAQVFTW